MTWVDAHVAVAALLLACGPRAEAEIDATDGTASSEGTSLAPESTATSATAEGAASTGGDDESSTTASAAELCAMASPDDCPSGCVSIDAYRIDDPETCAATPVSACVAASPPVDAVVRTYYRDDLAALVSGRCGQARAPDEWSECRLDGVDDPPQCACLCREGVCYGDDDRVALEACGVERLCPLAGSDEYPMYDREVAVCVLTALRDRTPGMVESWWSNGIIGEHTAAYLDGTGEVQIVHEDPDDFFVCPNDESDWHDAQRCTLADPSVFDACIAGDDWTVSDCLLASTNWFTDCQPTEPSCP